MGILVGLMLGLGIVLIVRTFMKPPPKKEKTGPTLTDRISELLTQAGIEAVTPAQLITVCAGTGIFVFLALFLVSRTWAVSLAFALMASYAPLALVRMRARSRRTELRDLWPDVVDNLASSVRAG